MGLLSKFFGQSDAAKTDARRIYRIIMEQSRKAVFYGDGRISDNYDGRIDVLTLHMACILKALNQHGEQGSRLGQALFDEMKDDFEVALRELGISDTGVAKRIKPMISHFYARVKIYTEALLLKPDTVGSDTLNSDTINSDYGNDSQALSAAFDSLSGVEDNPLAPAFKSRIISYTQIFSESLDKKTLGQIALCDFDFPKFAPVK